MGLYLGETTQLEMGGFPITVTYSILTVTYGRFLAKIFFDFKRLKSEKIAFFRTKACQVWAIFNPRTSVHSTQSLPDGTQSLPGWYPKFARWYPKFAHPSISGNFYFLLIR